MTGKEVLRQIIEGLEGVTGGKWCQFHPDFCEEAKDTRFSTWDTSHDLSAIVAGARRRIGTFTHASDAAHVDRCHPDAIRAIAAYVETLKSDLDAVTTYAAVLEAALEQICTDAKRVDVYSNGSLLDLVQPFLIDRARAALKGEPLYTQEGNAQ